MELKDFEKLLIQTFLRAKISVDQTVKNRILDQTLQAFSAQKKEFVLPFWKRIFIPRTSSIAFAAAALFILFNLYPSNETKLSAGELYPKNGVVEIVRDGQTILVKNNIALEKGDIIHVGNKAEAQIILPDSLESTLGERTQLQVMDRNSFFLHFGDLKGKSFDESAVTTTDRGVVKSSPGSDFHVSVSESGETKVVSEKNDLSVTDWKNGAVTLKQGEEVRLATDTVLPAHESDQSSEETRFSTFQLKSLDSKMVITRSKILTSLQKALSNDKPGASGDLESAQKTFKSIVEIFGRMDSVRKNLNSVAITDIVSLLQDKNVPLSFVQDAKALEIFLQLTDRNLNHISFGLEHSGVEAFDRFVLIDHLFSLATAEEKPYVEILKQKYVDTVAKASLDQGTPAEQAGYLDTTLSKIPGTRLGLDFIKRVRAEVK